MTEQEQKAFDQMREALIDIKYGLEGARIWGGMDWTYNPLHSFKYLPLRDKAEQALTAANAVQPDFSDQATIAGLEASIGHLSALVNEQLLLLEEVNENLGVDGIGVELDDDQSPTIAKVRAHLAAMAPPSRPAMQPQPMAYAVFSSNGNIRIWGHSPDDVKRIKAEFGSSLISLYAHPQATEPAGWKRDPLDLGQYVNDAHISANDNPVAVIEKLQAIINERKRGSAE